MEKLFQEYETAESYNERTKIIEKIFSEYKDKFTVKEGIEIPQCDDDWTFQVVSKNPLFSVVRIKPKSDVALDWYYTYLVKVLTALDVGLANRFDECLTSLDVSLWDLTIDKVMLIAEVWVKYTGTVLKSSGIVGFLREEGIRTYGLSKSDVVETLPIMNKLYRRLHITEDAYYGQAISGKNWKT